MSDLQAIATLYGQMDLHLRSLRDADDRAGEDPAPDPVDEEQRINDQAYFVLAWGQLEANIEEACREAIREGQSQEDWRHRRAWSLYNPDDRRLSGLSFENRLTLVLERGIIYLTDRFALPIFSEKGDARWQKHPEETTARG